MQTDKQSDNTQVDDAGSGGKLQWFKNKYEVILAIALVVILLLVLFTNKPGRYKPFRAQDPELVSPYLTHKLVPEFVNEVQLDQPFNMVIEQDGVNDIISRIGWFDDSATMTVSAPSVLFRQGTIYVMATVKAASVSTVVTVIAEPVVDREKIVFNLQSVKFGSIPMTVVAKRIVRKMIDEQMTNVTEDSTQKPFWKALLDNEPFDPTFEIEGTKVKITNAKFEKEKLTITILPVPEKE